MPEKPRILFVHINSLDVSFIKKDIDILSQNYEVRTVHYKTRWDIRRIIAGALWADLTLSWFTWDQAMWATRFSKLFRKKSVVIVGGFDVVKMPEIPYGNLLYPHPAARTLYALRKANKVIAVSNSLKKDAENFSGRTDIDIIYHGFDANQYIPPIHKERFALTVGGVNKSTLKRKGLETFIKTASLVPDIPFKLIGKVEPDILEFVKGMAPENLQLMGRVNFETLTDEMRKAAVYVQVSAHEGFGCSLAEAMLCGAVPVVTKRGAIPEVVGDTGIYVPYGDPRATAEAVRAALEAADGMKARKRVVDHFPLEGRRNRLLKLIDTLLTDAEEDPG